MPDYSSPVNAVDGFTINPTGLGPGSALSTIFAQTAGAVAMVDSAATSVGTITIPNVAASFSGLVILRVGLTLAGHIYDSTRSWTGSLAVTRTPGAVAVGTLTIVTGAGVIATSGAGGAYTMTLTVALGTVGGGATATNTFAINVTSTGSTASTAECQCTIIGTNGAAGGITFA